MAVVVPVQLAMALAMASVVTKLDPRPLGDPLHLRHPAGHLRPCRRADLAGDLRADRVPQLGAAGLGVIEKPVLFLSYQHPWVIFLAVVLAEIWRATAIMMVILVAGMGLIPKEYGEAARGLRRLALAARSAG